MARKLIWQLAENASIFAHEWTEMMLDSWVLICIAAFVGYALVTDIRNKRRRKIVLEVDRNAAKKLEESVLAKSTAIMLSAYAPTSNLSSSSSIPSMVDIHSLNNQNSSSAENIIPKQNGSNSPHVGESPTIRTPKVNFRPIPHDVVTGEEEEPLKLTIPPDVPRPEPKRSLFVPFVGKRLNRDNSNTSLASVASILNKTPTGRLPNPTLSPAMSPISISIRSGLDRLHSPSIRSPSGVSVDNGSRNSSPNTFDQSERSTPTMDRVASDKWHIALERDECCICFKLLHQEEVAVCADQDGSPVCLHIYHSRCLRVLKHRRCLFCGARFHFRRRIPDMEKDPKGWFSTVDVDKSGGLTPLEIGRVLAAQLPIDRKACEALLTKNWNRWDSDKSGEVDQTEFFAAKGGLLAYLKRKRTLFKQFVPDLEVPDIRDDARLWFQYFDQDGSKELDKYEVLRGLIVSFDLHRDARICLNLRMVLDAVWPIFDKDGNGTISEEEFLEPKTGLATSLVISLNHSDNGRLY